MIVSYSIYSLYGNLTKGEIMKKLTLFSILSVLLYSAPGYTARRGTADMDQSLRGKGKGHAAGRGTGDMNQALRGKGKGGGKGKGKGKGQGQEAPAWAKRAAEVPAWAKRAAEERAAEVPAWAKRAAEERAAAVRVEEAALAEAAIQAAAIQAADEEEKWELVGEHTLPEEEWEFVGRHKSPAEEKWEYLEAQTKDASKRWDAARAKVKPALMYSDALCSESHRLKARMEDALKRWECKAGTETEYKQLEAQAEAAKKRWTESDKAGTEYKQLEAQAKAEHKRWSDKYAEYERLKAQTKQEEKAYEDEEHRVACAQGDAYERRKAESVEWKKVYDQAIAAQVESDKAGTDYDQVGAQSEAAYKRWSETGKEAGTETEYKQLEAQAEAAKKRWNEKHKMYEEYDQAYALYKDMSERAWDARAKLKQAIAQAKQVAAQWEDMLKREGASEEHWATYRHREFREPTIWAPPQEAAAPPVPSAPPLEEVQQAAAERLAAAPQKEALAAPERANDSLAEILERAETMEKKLREEGCEIEWKVVQVPASVQILGFNPESGEYCGGLWYVEGDAKAVLQMILGQKEPPSELAPAAAQRSAFEFDFLPLAEILERAEEKERELIEKGCNVQWSVKDSHGELMLGGYNSTSGEYAQNTMFVEDPSAVLQVLAGRRAAQSAPAAAEDSAE